MAEEGMHRECGHTVHSHLDDTHLVTFLPTDSLWTLHKKNSERFAETVIIDRLKKYIDEDKHFIGAL